MASSGGRSNAKTSSLGGAGDCRELAPHLLVGNVRLECQESDEEESSRADPHLLLSLPLFSLLKHNQPLNWAPLVNMLMRVWGKSSDLLPVLKSERDASRILVLPVRYPVGTGRLLKELAALKLQLETRNLSLRLHMIRARSREAFYLRCADQVVYDLFSSAVGR